MKKISLFFFLSFLFGVNVHGACMEKSISSFPDTNQVDTVQQKLNPPQKKFSPKRENKKLIAAILAFPVPFGFLGLHRIYLGTDPWIPVVYLVTAGGGMVLPLLDFIAILCADKDALKSYENNKKLFMWVDKL